MTERKPNAPPAELADAALDAVTGGAETVAQEITHVVQQSATAQLNPKELTVEQSVPWRR